jgi:hypothetical protein
LKEQRAEGGDMTDSSLKIPKNPFNSIQVKFSRIMHVKAHLLNGISNVWLGKSKILELQ